MKYYGLATTKQGANVVINNLPDYRLGAVNAAQLHCQKEGLNFESVRQVKNEKKGGSTLTKEKKLRTLKLNASKKR